MDRLAAAAPHAGILEPHPRGDSRIGGRRLAVDGRRLGDSPAGLRRRLHDAAAVRTERRDARRSCREHWPRARASAGVTAAPQTAVEHGDRDARDAAGGARLPRRGGTIGQFVWPWQACRSQPRLPRIAVVKSLSADVIAPLVARQPVDRSWPKSILRGGPNYFIGASLAVGLVETLRPPACGNSCRWWQCRCISPIARTART